jgi:hypothetical protein
MVFEEGFRLDLVVDGRVIVEIKSVEQLARQYAKQLLAYLKVANISVGLLINFGAPTLRERIAPDRQWLRTLRVSAAPREPTRCREQIDK